jgi:hypothetical protein
MKTSDTKDEGGPDKVLVSFGDDTEKFPAEIRNLSGSSIKLWMKRGVNAGALVRIEVAHGFHQTGTVLYCKADETGGFTIVIDFDRTSEQQARNEVRTAYAQPATISELGLRGKSSPYRATTVDLSRTGIGLRMSRPLPVRTLVRIVLPDSIVFGEVRHCRAEGSKQFRVGISIEWKMSRSADPAGGRLQECSKVRSVTSWILLRFRRLTGGLRRQG